MSLNIQDVVNYYTNLLIVQYRTKPKATATMALLASEALAGGLPQTLERAFDLDTAIGAQLDIIGNLVGVPRYCYGLDLNHTFFSFVRYNDLTPRPGFGRYNENPYPASIWLRYISDSVLEMTDFEMLACIQLKIIQNNSFTSLADVSEALWTAFANDITIVENILYTPAEGGIDSYTQLMLHLNNNVTDSSTKGFTVTNNNVTFANTSPAFAGTYYGVFNGTTAKLSVPDNAALVPGTGNFTIDFLVNVSSLSANPSPFGQYNSGTGAFQFLWLNPNGSITWKYYNGSTYLANYTTTSSGLLSTGSWYHIALVRSGTNIYLFLNGTSVFLTASTPIGTNNLTDISAPFLIGSDGQGEFFTGNMQEFRWSNTARWTSNFTPPPSPYGSPAVYKNMSITYHASPYNVYYSILEIAQFLNILPKPMGVALSIASP